MKKLWLLTWMCVLTLAACDGGGSGADPVSVTLSGTAATGLPIANTSVNIKCSSPSGAIVVDSTTTDANGAYRHTVSGAQAPCMVQVAYTDSTGTPARLVGLALNAGTANITPLTHALLSSGLNVPDTQTFFSGLNFTGIQSLQAVDFESLWAALGTNLNSLGVSTAGITSPFTGTLLADASNVGKGYDGVLEALKSNGYTTAQLINLANTVNVDSIGGTSPTLVSIQITPATTSKPAGLTEQYTAIGTYTSGPNKDITSSVIWGSSNTSVATINSAGLAAALASGTAQITAQLSGVTSNAATLTVTPAALVSIQVTPANASIAAGLTQQYTAIGTYTSGPNQDISASVTWESTNTSAATINNAGLATAVATGPTGITAQLNGITSNTAALNVTAATLVTIQITPSTTSKAAGLTQQYAAMGTYTAGPNQDISALVTWSSSDTAKAAINSTGLATTLAPGSTAITAQLGGVASNTATLNVTAAALLSIQVSPPTASKAAGLTQQYTATGTYTDSSTQDITSTVSWNSSDTSKVTVSNTGLATTVAVGSTNIAAQLGGVTSNTATLTVTPASLVSIQVTPANATVGEGLTQQYTATGTYTSGPTQDLTSTASWNSSDTAKATINSAGLATVATTGTTNITAQFSGVTSNTASLVGVARTFAFTGSMNSSRNLHTATLLPNGKVLVTGGNSGGGGSMAGAELYDPATEVWTNTGFLSTSRYRHTATLLPNGKVLVTGGISDGSSLASAELYDPTTGVWTSTSSMSTSRYSHTATLLPDGKVLVNGGSSGSGNYLTSAELYNPATGVWTSTGSTFGIRFAGTATLLNNGTVLVAGGSDLRRTELYDPATGTWTNSTSVFISIIRYYHTATLLPNGKVLVAGAYVSSSSLSSTAELYDPATNTWTNTASMGTGRSNHTATLLPNGKVLVAGGAIQSLQEAPNSMTRQATPGRIPHPWAR